MVSPSPQNTLRYHLQNYSYVHQQVGINALEEMYIKELRALDDEQYKNTIVPILALLLAEIIEENDRKSSNVKSFFDSPIIPEISIEDYLNRIIKYAPCSKECIIVAFVYMDEIIQNKNFLITSHNIHRLLITSIMIASKVMEDFVYNNKYYSHVGGIALQELNSLECKYLCMLEHNLSIPPGVFECYRSEIEKCYFQNQLNQEAKMNYGFELSHSMPDYMEVKQEQVKLPNRHMNMIGEDKKLRRSKSLCENGFMRRKRRSWSFHVDPFIVIA